MNNVLAFSARNRHDSYAWINHLPVRFKKNVITGFNGNARFRVQQSTPGLYKDETSINSGKPHSFNYEEWHWKDIAGCGYIDNLKKQHPDLSHILIFKDYRSVVNTLLQRDFHPIDAENMNKFFLAGLIWRYFKRKSALKQFYKKNAPLYLKIWLKYNDAFLNNIKRMPRDSYVLLDEKNINPDDARVSAYLLKNWNLSLRYFKFKQTGDLYGNTNEPNGALLDKIISLEKNNCELSIL